MPSLARYEVLLPLLYNDGTHVEESKHQICFDEVVARFGGDTLEPHALSGRWISGHREFEDTLIRLVVEVDDVPESHEWFSFWKGILQERFDQFEIRMTWHPIHIV